MGFPCSEVTALGLGRIIYIFWSPKGWSRWQLSKADNDSLWTRQWVTCQRSSMELGRNCHPRGSQLNLEPRGRFTLLVSLLLSPVQVFGLKLLEDGFFKLALFKVIPSHYRPTCQCRRLKRCRFNSWVCKIPWMRAWQPTPVLLPGESPWTQEPGRLQSTGYLSQTWLSNLSTNIREKI